VNLEALTLVCKGQRYLTEKRRQSATARIRNVRVQRDPAVRVYVRSSQVAAILAHVMIGNADDFCAIRVAAVRCGGAIAELAGRLCGYVGDAGKHGDQRRTHGSGLYVKEYRVSAAVPYCVHNLG
jgi:hypothetical protein